MYDYSEMILHLIYSFENQQQKVNINLLRQNFVCGENQSVVLEEEIDHLIDKGFLLKTEDKQLLLTDYGRIKSIRASKAIIKDEFSNKIDRLTRSKAYLDYCEEVYGYRMYLFNMMDKQQLNFLFNIIKVSSDDTVVDLGCVFGRILNLLVAKYECKGIGIDQMNGDIVERNSKLVTYINGDIDKMSEYRLKPTITLSVDSLYFSSNLDRLVGELRDNSKMYLFYSQYLFEDCGDKRILHSDNTTIACILNKNGVPYKTIDYSENERLLYEKSLRVLQKYRKEFEQEGNKDLYEGKYNEDITGKSLYEHGLASRFLYIVD